MQSVVEGLLAFSGRGACTDAERRGPLAARRAALARDEAWVTTRWVRPQRYETILLGCLLTVAGGLPATAAAAEALGHAGGGCADRGPRHAG